MKGLYYYTKRTYQFSQSKQVFERLGGTFIINWEYPKTILHFLIRYGPFRIRLMGKRFSRIDRSVKGIILCHSGEYIVPPGRNYRRVFVYHGTCDTVYKAQGPNDKLLAEWFEYYFVTGDKDLHKLRKYTYNADKLEGKIVRTGMFRSDSIITGSFDREKILRKYGIHSDGKKIVLYAPTWAYGGGTLSELFETFAKEIPKQYVLIVRPHANDRVAIKYIRSWQRSHHVRDLYIFPKPAQDIMDFVSIADVLIGDNSAVNYDFVLTGRPLVLVRSDEHENLFVPPDEYNIKLCVPMYEHGKDSILEKIEVALHNPEYKKRTAALVHNSFYFNDGHVVDRVCSFIVDALSDMGVVDREKVMRKYGKRFEYRSDYIFKTESPLQ